MDPYGRLSGRTLRRKRLVRSENAFDSPTSLFVGIIRESLLQIALPVNISLEDSVYDRSNFAVRLVLFFVFFLFKLFFV